MKILLDVCLFLLSIWACFRVWCMVRIIMLDQFLEETVMETEDE